MMTRPHLLPLKQNENKQIAVSDIGGWELKVKMNLFMGLIQLSR